MKKVRTRFAPSPTGYMHIGNLRTALYGYLYAMKEGGDFILRLEDTDSKRYVDGAVQIIYDTLKDAGIRYAEGPDVGGDFGPYIQSERGAIYRAYAEKLVELGGAYHSGTYLRNSVIGFASTYLEHSLRLVVQFGANMTTGVIVALVEMQNRVYVYLILVSPLHQLADKVG